MKRASKIAAALGGVLAAGAAAFYIREKTIEKPRHAVLAKDGAFELRSYAPYLVAETVEEGGRERAVDTAFRRLADYIFAKSRGGGFKSDDKIAMTAPVTAEPEADGRWRVAFMMPSKYDRETLPPPGPGVAIGERPARRVAVVKFGGVPDDAAMHDKEAELRGWIAGRNLRPRTEAWYAFYNSPFIPGPLRRNEVLIEIE